MLAHRAEECLFLAMLLGLHLTRLEFVDADIVTGHLFRTVDMIKVGHGAYRLRSTIAYGTRSWFDLRVRIDFSNSFPPQVRKA
jgi:hypothetical protein